MEINLLPSPSKHVLPQSERGRKSLALMLLGVAIVLCGGALYTWMGQRVSRLQSQETALQTQLKQASVARKPQAEANRQSTDMQQIIATRRPLDTMMKSLGSGLIAGMTVDAIHSSSDGLEVDGRTANLGDVAAYQAYLEKLPWAQSVSVMHVTQSTGKSLSTAVFERLQKGVAIGGLLYTYSISITYAPAAGGESQ